MKKILSIILCVLVILASVSIIASSKDEGITVIYDGEVISFDVEPEIINDRVMVPMRTIFETFGAKVKWDDETQTITAKKKSKTIEMTIDSTEMTKNDEVYSFDTAPTIKDDRTLIPIRAISELLGLDVEWDEATQTVIITSSSDEDDSWKENKGEIDLSSFTVTGDNNTVSANVITITEGGDYTVTGTSDNGQIVIDSEDKVKLRLSGMSLTNQSGSAIYIKNADKAYITVTKGTENYLADAENYISGDEKEKGCITARDNLEIKGEGSLSISGNYNHAIFAADSLEIEGGNISINSKNDGIHVNDTFAMSDGALTISAEGDGIASDEIVDITGGSINITTTGDVPAGTNERDFMFGRGQMSINQTAQSEQASETESEDNTDISSKGIKAGWLLDISAGSINITSTDHAIHCASDMNINGGNITISSDNKGISAHGDLIINGGSFDIVKATEGIESKQIMTINDGKFNIIASDDGLNAGGTGGFPGGGMGFGGRNNAENFDGNMPDMSNMPNMDGMPQMGDRPQMGEISEMGDMPQMGGRPDIDNMPNMENRPQIGDMPDMSNMPDMENMPQMGGRGGMPMGDFGGNSTEISSEHHIQINGGEFYICATNDGIDSNGSLVIEGGTIVIEGRSAAGGGEMGLDTDMALIINGGEVLAAGSVISESGAGQNTALIYLSESAQSGSTLEIKSSDGETLSSITTKKTMGQVLYSSSKLQEGKEYSVYVDGTLKDTFTVSGKVTTVGTATNGGFGGGMGGFGGGRRNMDTTQQTQNAPTSTMRGRGQMR